MIKVITGVRRCGKSCLMQLIAEELESEGVASENIIYIDLDKRNFHSIKQAKQLEELIDRLSTAQGMKYLFIDEIQNVSHRGSLYGDSFFRLCPYPSMGA